MKKHQLSVSLDAALVEMLQARAADMHLSLSAVLNYTLWQSLRPATPAAPTAAPTAATPAAAPDDESWKKWQGVPPPNDAAEALALCKAAGLDMSKISEDNAQLAWLLYSQAGDM